MAVISLYRNDSIVRHLFFVFVCHGMASRRIRVVNEKLSRRHTVKSLLTKRIS